MQASIQTLFNFIYIYMIIDKKPRLTLKAVENRFESTLKAGGLMIYKWGVPATYSVRSLDGARIIFNNNTLAKVKAFLTGLENQNNQARRKTI